MLRSRYPPCQLQREIHEAHILRRFCIFGAHFTFWPEIKYLHVLPIFQTYFEVLQDFSAPYFWGGNLGHCILFWGFSFLFEPFLPFFLGHLGLYVPHTSVCALAKKITEPHFDFFSLVCSIFFL